MVDDDRVSFSGACGLGGPLRVRVETGLAEVPPLDLTGPHAIIGRASRADVVVDDPEVSQRHAYLQVIAGRLFCIDLNSRTGVRWGDDRRPLGWIEPGQGIGIGPVRLRFEGVAPGEGGPWPISRASASPTLPDARIEFHGPGPVLKPWQVSRALVLVGSSATCRVRFEGREIAGIHAALLRTPSGVWVVDLLGPGGVSVDGSPVRSHRVEDGDEVGVGGHRFLVRLGPAARPDSGKGLARWSSGREALSTPSSLHPSPRTAEGPEVAELLAGFERMHQRTSDQFQQALLMMFQMHQDQMSLIRDELSKIDRLEEELKSLQAEQARVNPPVPSRAMLRLIGAEPARPDDLDAGPDPARADPAPGLPSVPPARPGPRPSAVGEPGRAPAPAPALGLDDPHARLNRKLEEIQAERRGLWKKLLGSMVGDQDGRLLP